MSYRKLNADHLFTGQKFLSSDDVLVVDDKGTIEAIVPLAEAGEGLEKFEGILSPGFVNCHCHLELSHMKGMIPEKSGMSQFVLAVVQQRHLSEEAILKSINEAENEMLQNGVVAVGDICNNLITIRQKHQGNLYYHNFIEASGFVPSIAGQRFTRSVDFFNAFAQLYPLPVESNSIVPHAPYSVSPELFERILSFPGNHIMTMHNQEAVAEEELFLRKEGDFLQMYKEMNIDISFFKATGKSSLQAALPYFKKNQKLLLVHNVTTNENDISYLRHLHHSPDIYFCLCVNANLYIGNGLPDIPLLANSGFPLVIGTDSLASNKQLHILEELKTIQENFPSIQLGDLLQWATLNGAQALELDKLFGSFEKGKSPGVIHIANIYDRRITGSTTVERII